MTFCPIERKGRQLCVMINAIQFYVPYVQQFFISENVCHLGQPKKYLCLREEPNCVFLSRTALQSVGLLKFICQLTISSFVINFMDLKMLCENHENLIIVEVLLHFRNRVLPEVLEDSTSALSRLRMFSFSPARDDYDKESFRLLWRACLVHLPKLHIIRARVGSVGSNSVHPEEVIQFMTDPQLNNKIYELRHLLIIPEICPYPVMFPRVTHLEIMWPEDMIFTEEDVHATMTFVTTLKSLSLINVPCANTLTRYLKRYGLNLTELLLSNSPGWDDDAFNYDLKNIFALCPALEKLRLTGINLLDTSSPPKFSKLRRLHFQSHERARNNFAVIVRAPELKDLFLEGANFDLNDISEVASLIKSGHILGKLERLHIIATKIPNPHSVYIRRMRELVLNASAYLKTLTDVNLLTKVGMQRDKILSSFKLNRLLQLYNGRGC
ncbi:uncharacterized protein LOC135946425 [Cloeon dipterum]|uniref:uncharacterized protein LOC135946425 n=1 Tax=Cloeon dipterum TaxID=197152 RepID=UPI00321F770F